MLRHHFAWTGYVALIISQHPSMLVVGGSLHLLFVSGSLHCCCLGRAVFARGCSWEKGGAAHGCAGSDVEEREKYVMVVNGYCG